MTGTDKKTDLWMTASAGRVFAEASYGKMPHAATSEGDGMRGVILYEACCVAGIGLPCLERQLVILKPMKYVRGCTGP